MNKLNFNFSLEETNLIIEGLAELQAKRVHNLILKIRVEAQKQLEKETSDLSDSSVEENKKV